MVDQLLLDIHHGARSQSPLSVIEPTSFLQRLWQLFTRPSAINPQILRIPASSILHQIQQHPSYKAFRQPQTRAPTMKEPASKLESLPNEMQLMIMKRLGDISSLRSLSLASHTFNHLRIQHEKVVLPAVLANEIDESVFDEAYWALRASQQGFDPSNFLQRITDFIAEWFESDPESIKVKDLPVADLMKISCLHRHVNSLVKDFCVYALSGPLSPSESPKDSPSISALEFNRIARAFYRFELYCNLYKDHPVGDHGASQNDRNTYMRLSSYKLFDSWNAWEVEGVACVRDYFCARLTDAFANIQKAACDAPLQVHIRPCYELLLDELPENHIKFCDGLVPDWYDETAPSGATFLHQGRNTKRLKEMFMSRGLTFLCRFLMASSGYEQYQIFQSIMHNLISSSTSERFITHALRERPLCMQDDGDMMEAFCHGDEQRFEGDVNVSAPPFAWVWANGGSFQPFYAEERMEYLRSLGYVMWDHERVSQIALFQKPPLQPPEFFDSAPSREAMIAAHQSRCSRTQPETGNSLDHEIAPPSHGWPDQTEIEILDETSGLSNQVVEDDSSVSIPEVGAVSACTQSDKSKEEESSPTWTNPIQSIDHASNSSAGSKNSTTELATRVETITTAPALKDASLLLLGAEPVFETFMPKPSSCEQAGLCPQMPINETLMAGCKPTSSISSESRMTGSSSDDSSNSSRPSFPSQVHSAGQKGPVSEDSSTENLFGDGMAVSEHDARAENTTQDAIEADHVVGAPLPRKIARAISPRTKMLKLQEIAGQKAQAPATDSRKIGELSTIDCKNPEPTVVQLRASSPPASDCSSTSSASHCWITSEASSTTSKKPFMSFVKDTESGTGSSLSSTKNDGKLQQRGAWHAAPSVETDQESEQKVHSQNTLVANIDCSDVYTKDPEEVAAWIENSDSCDPQQPGPPSPPLFDSFGSSSSSAETIPTKQQRKKANRKARKAATELAIKQAQQMEEERVKKEESKRKHQKSKKERKKLEKKMKGAKAEGKGKSQVRRAEEVTESRGTANKVKKTGYLIC